MCVATVPTVYGIETIPDKVLVLKAFSNNVATVPTVYGIETIHTLTLTDPQQSVATVPTVYGIETRSLLN